MVLPYIVLVVILFLLELFYFRQARKFSIIDKPNNRSSHETPTIRGGGVIFFMAGLIWFVYQEFKWPWMMAGLTLLALISFLDDLKPRSALWRFVMHAAAVLFIFYQVPLFDWPWWLVAMALIVCIGALSAFNFMDGINGITGIYALVSLGSFAWINWYSIAFTDDTLIFVLISSVLVFLFFNFRKRAACFAGDVGSITIAFVQIFFLLKLIHKTNNFYWVLIFLVYGLDTVITIVYRIRNKENIFMAHRSHLYQFLSNELEWDHRFVALTYGIVQCLINGILIHYITVDTTFVPILIAALALILYMISREYVLRRIKCISSK